MKHPILGLIALLFSVPMWAQSPTPVVVTDGNGNQLQIVGSTTGVHFGGPTSVVLTDKNGNILNLGSGGSGGTVGSCATTNAIAIYTAATTTGCGNADFTYAAHTLTGAGSGALAISSNGATSFSPILFSGTPFTGGTGTTTFPLIRFDSGVAPTTWNTSGTILGFNAPSGFNGLYVDFHLNGSTSVFSVTNLGNVTTAGSVTASAGSVSAANLLGGTINSTTNCKANGTAASPSVVTCGAAAAGLFSCATNASTATCQVNTTAVTANSEIQIIQDAADGGASQLNVTCNTALVTPAAKPILLSKSAGANFIINLGTITTNPGCFEYLITN